VWTDLLGRGTTPAHRERVLLSIAAAFVGLGTATLYTAAPTFGLLRALALTLPFLLSFATAHVVLSRLLPRRDPLLLPTAALLTGWGLLLIGRLAPDFLLRQTIWLVISTAALLGVVRLGSDLRWLRRFRYTWLFGGLALLAATLIFGVNPSGHGPRLWLGAFGMYFQPSELLKLLMTVYVASYLAEKRGLLVSERWRVGRWPLPSLAYIGPLLVMFGLAMVILAWQQDLGAALLFFSTFLAMLYLATEQRGYILMGLIFFLAVGLAGYHFSDRVALRVDTWLNPWPEAADRAFQIVQSLLAFGAGGVFGQGLGLGRPTYIPAVHTDFVFAAVAEEFGLAGVLAIAALYATLLLRGFRAAARSYRPFQRFLAAGLTTGLIVQAWVIMAGNAGLAPITGVTLPFVSYGGSSLLTSFIALGLLLRISASPSEAHVTASTPVYHRQVAQTSLLHLTLFLTLALGLLTMTCGYWTVAQAGPLRARQDNPRRVLYEQRIARGRILDRRGEVLADMTTTGNGIVTRSYPVPEAAPVVGYASLRYGTGGIEAAFDACLRGEADRSPWQVAWQELLHRPPQGRDVQLTLDTALQVQAQEALGSQAGAAVLLNAASGEVLALASAPTFDPEHLDEMWERLAASPDAPLVNRATQGLYQPGAAVQTVVIAEALDRSLASLSTPADNPTAMISLNGTEIGCNPTAEAPATLAEVYAAACPAPVAALGEQMGLSRLREAVERWALTTPPRLEIPTEAADWRPEAISTTAALRAEAIGQGRLTVTPLQMALLAGTLANEGTMPAPRLVRRLQDPSGQWSEAPARAEPRAVLSPAIARQLLLAWPTLARDIRGYSGNAVAGEGRPPHAWFLGVTPSPGRGGAETRPYAVAVLIEHAPDPELAADIGVALLTAASAH